MLTRLSGTGSFINERDSLVQMVREKIIGLKSNLLITPATRKESLCFQQCVKGKGGNVRLWMGLHFFGVCDTVEAPRGSPHSAHCSRTSEYFCLFEFTMSTDLL